MTAVIEDAAPLLSLDEVQVSYGERLVLLGLTWHLPARGVHALMGPGGVGKTTLMELICHPEVLRARAQVTGGVQWHKASPNQTLAACAVQKPKLFNGSMLSYMMEAHSARGQWTPGEQRVWLEGFLAAEGFPELAAQTHSPMIDLNPWERRVLTLLRANLSQPLLLCVDEPTRGVPDAAAERICHWLQRVGRTQSVVFVTHHHAQARQLSQSVALLAGGKVQAHLPTDAFFSADAPPLVQHFVKTGGCSLPSPSARPEELDPAFDSHGAPPPEAVAEAARLDTQRATTAVAAEDVHFDTPAAHAHTASRAAILGTYPVNPTARAPLTAPPSAFQGPRGFRWVIPGLLAGTPQPGLIEEVEVDIAALQRVGIRTLITLTEYRREAEAIDRAGFQVIWFPVPDMGAPSVPDAVAFLAQTIDPLLKAHTPIAFHCHAGLGRTGTLLAACLIWLGASADEAIDQARSAEPRYIQSNVQLQFLMNLSHHLKKNPDLRVAK